MTYQIKKKVHVYFMVVIKPYPASKAKWVPYGLNVGKTPICMGPIKDPYGLKCPDGTHIFFWLGIARTKRNYRKGWSFKF